MEVFAPWCASVEPLSSAGEFERTLVEGIGAEKGELWGGTLFIPTTGNRGCDTGTGGMDVGSPGGVICDGRCAGVDDGGGGLTFCTGNNGCGT